MSVMHFGQILMLFVIMRISGLDLDLNILRGLGLDLDHLFGLFQGILDLFFLGGGGPDLGLFRRPVVCRSVVDVLQGYRRTYLSLIHICGQHCYC